MATIETPERREAHEAHEAFHAGKIGVVDYISKQLPGTKVEHGGTTYLSTMDGPQVLTRVPINKIGGRHLQVYRNTNAIQGYRTNIQGAKAAGKNPEHALEPISVGHSNTRPGELYLGDGHHRVDAAEAEGLTHLRAWMPTKEQTMNPVQKLARRLKGKVQFGAGPHIPVPHQATIPHPELHALAHSYSQSQGRKLDTSPLIYTPVDEHQAHKVADQFESMAHDPNHPDVRRSYDAFKRETLGQFQHLQKAGYRFMPDEDPGEGQDKATQVINRIRNQKEVPVYTGGNIPADHPLAEMSSAVSNGRQLTYNEVFRGVHNVFGHALHGVRFGATGENHAFKSHARMYSPEALPALTSETKGQNSWVHFGPHRKETVENRPYAEQKANIMKLTRSGLVARLAKRLKIPTGREKSGGDVDRLYNAGYMPYMANSWYKMTANHQHQVNPVTTEEALQETNERASKFDHPDIFSHPPINKKHPACAKRAAELLALQAAAAGRHSIPARLNTFIQQGKHRYTVTQRAKRRLEPDDPRQHLLKAGWSFFQSHDPSYTGQTHEAWLEPKTNRVYPYHEAIGQVMPLKPVDPPDWRPSEMTPEDYYTMKRQGRPVLFAVAKDALQRIKGKGKQKDLFKSSEYSGKPTPPPIEKDPYEGVDFAVEARPTIKVPAEHSLANHDKWLDSHLLDHEKESVGRSRSTAGHVSSMLPVESTVHAALAGRHGRHWYDENHDILKMANQHSKDPMDFYVDAGLESAFSPRNGILWNQMAKEDIKRIRHNGAVVDGNLIPPRTRDPKHIKAYLEAYAKGKGIDYPPDYSIPELRGKPMLAQETTKRGVRNLIHTDEGWVWKPPIIQVHRDLATKVLTNPERFTNPHGHETLTSKPEKADSFLRNKLGNQGAVTVDTWHARGRGYNGSIVGGVYHTLAGLTRHTTSLLNLPEYNPLKDHPIYGQGWTPARTQAAEWMTYRGLGDLMAKGATPEQAALGLKAKDIHATSSFLELYKHPEMRARLRTMIREGHVNPAFFSALQTIEDRYRPTSDEMEENVGHPALIEVARRIYPFLKGADRKVKDAAKKKVKVKKERPRRLGRLLEQAKSLLKKQVPQVTFHPGKSSLTPLRPGRDLEEHTALVAKGLHLKHASHDVALPHPEAGYLSGLLDTKGPGSWSGGYEERYVQSRVPHLLNIWDGFVAPTHKGDWVLVDKTANGYHSIRNPGASGGTTFPTHDEAVAEATRRALAHGGKATQEELRAATKKAKGEFQKVMAENLYGEHDTTIKQAARNQEAIQEHIVADPLATPTVDAVRQLFRSGKLRRLQEAVTFVSPNTGELDFETALTALRSANHSQFRKTAGEVFKRLGLSVNQQDAIGDWQDGAENSLVNEVQGKHDPRSSRLAAAWLGLLGRQKSVLHFVADPSGPDSVYQAHVPITDLNLLRSQLDQHGIPFRTLIPSQQGTGVTLYDEGRTVRDKFHTFAGSYNAPVRETIGRGEFIGGADRSSAAKAYRDIIGQSDPTGHGNDPSGTADATGRRQAPAGGLVHRGVFYEGGKTLPNSP